MLLLILVSRTRANSGFNPVPIKAPPKSKLSQNDHMVDLIKQFSITVCQQIRNVPSATINLKSSTARYENFTAILRFTLSGKQVCVRKILSCCGNNSSARFRICLRQRIARKRILFYLLLHFTLKLWKVLSWKNCFVFGEILQKFSFAFSRRKPRLLVNWCWIL